MAITPTGISWLDQWILSQGGTLAGQDTDVPPVTSPQPTYESSRRFLKRYISGDSEGSDDYDSNPTGGYAPDIGIGESFQSLITSAAGLFDKFDVGSIFDVGEGAKGLFSGGLEGLIEGAKTDFSNLLAEEFDPLNTYTAYNQGPLSNMIRALQDPSVGTGRKVGASILGIGSTVLGGPFGLFGSLASVLNSMGAFHEWDPDQDSNLAFNPATSKFEWDSETPGGGGIQWGPKSARNMAEDITKNHPDEWVTIQNEEGDKMGQIQGKDLSNWVDQTMGVLGPDGRMSMSAYQDPFALGYMDDVFGTGPSMSLEFPGMTDADAMSSLSNMYGNAWNSLAADNPNLGYNQLATLASQKASELGDFIDLGGYYDSGPYGGVDSLSGLSMDDAMAAAMEEAGPTGTVDSGSEGDSAGGAGGVGGSLGGADDFSDSDSSGDFFCLSPDTKVKTKDGLKEVKNLKVGDTIKSIYGYGTVTEVINNHIRSGYYCINDDLHITNDHPILTKKGWYRTEDLKIGDDLGGTIVKSIDYIEGPVETVSITTDTEDFNVYGKDVVYSVNGRYKLSLFKNAA